MARYDYITEDDFNELKEEPLGLDFCNGNARKEFLALWALYFLGVDAGVISKHKLNRRTEENGYRSQPLQLSVTRSTPLSDSRMRTYQEESHDDVAHERAAETSSDEHWKGRNLLI